MAVIDHRGAGDVLNDRYTLRRAAWTSALGPVWEARDGVLGRTVFLQLLAPSLVDSSSVRKAFQRAAASMAQVQNPGLLRVFDIGDDPPFVVFEHASGARLSDRIAHGPMRQQDAVRTALTIARVLEAIHEAGLSHGSLGPTSVMFEPDGRAQVISLGASEALAGVPAIDPKAEQPDGYRAPGSGDAASADRYALAALTWHMLTGRPPGGGGTRRLMLPSGLQSLLQKSMDPNPSNRPTLDAFIAGLAPFSRPDAPKARRPRTVAAEFRWLTPVIVIVVLAVLAGTIGLSLVQQLAEPAPDASPTTTMTAVGPPGETVAPASVEEFDPHGDGKETPSRVPFLNDGDLGTVWRTQNYASVGMDKTGVGVLVDLGEPVALREIRISTPLTGWTGEIRIGDASGADETALTEVADFTAEAENVIAFDQPTSARFVLIWITRLVEHNASGEFPHRAEISEFSLVRA